MTTAPATPISTAINTLFKTTSHAREACAVSRRKFGEPRLSRVRNSYLNLPKQVGALPVPFSSAPSFDKLRTGQHARGPKDTNTRSKKSIGSSVRFIHHALCRDSEKRTSFDLLSR